MAHPLPSEAERFYLRPAGYSDELWHEVSRQDYVRAEQAAGFSAPSGVPATYAFGTEYIEGCSRAPGEPAPAHESTADGKLPDA